MTERTIKSQAIWLAAGAVLLTLAGLVSAPLTVACKKDYRITVDQDNPEMGLLTAIPGGLRVPVIVWNQIQIDERKNAGKQYDAVQRAELICRLMPYFPSIWTFYANDMIWNRSVQTRTPDERWMWIANGIRLLRDEAMPRNPRAVLLFKELSWAYCQKIGGSSDDMHYFYKQRLAKEMQDLLGSPPSGSTADVIAAFGPVAQAQIDRNLPGSDRQIIQEKPLKELLKDPAAAQYVSLLAGQNIALGRPFLNAYNRFTLDEPVAATRYLPAEPKTDRDKKLSELVNSPEHARARAKILAFLRAQMLWNVYKMDPAVMFDLMKKHNAPFDWRNAFSHGFYWAYLGNQIIGESNIAGLSDSMQMNLLNNERHQLSSIRELTWEGRMTYRENPRSANYPDIWFNVDVRYVQPAHDLHVYFNTLQARATKVQLDQAQIADGHANYLTTAVELLVALNKAPEAQKYYDYLRETYKRAGGCWDEKDARDFVIYRLVNNFEMYDSFAKMEIEASLMTALVALARGDSQSYGSMYYFAQRVQQTWNKKSADRMKFPPLELIGGAMLTGLVMQPYVFGYEISLPNRSAMYRSAPLGMQLRAYLEIGHARSPMPRLCKAEGIDFAKAFPVPEGFGEYQEKMNRLIQQQKPADKDARQYEFKKPGD
ncbi:MAG: hypothetical protein HZA50_00775 [Planctomycetes bacterium]|nr:hypothetical protein [Planctomycetota bacterium]